MISLMENRHFQSGGVTPSEVRKDMRNAGYTDATCELKGIKLRNCPAFLREWVASEQLRITAEPP
jgi:hypothetical protein